MKQLDMFDLIPLPGTWVERHGERISWEDLKVGDIVVYDMSTTSHEWLRIVRVEMLLEKDGDKRWSDRAVCYCGEKQRLLIDREYDPRFYRMEGT